MTNPIPTAREVTRLVAGRQLSARENLDFFLSRIDQYNPLLNAVIHDGRERALERAIQIDADLAAGRPVGRLAGVVMTIKESFDVQGWPTTFGLTEFADHVAARTADVVQRLEAEGALIVGKTNVPPYLKDWQSGNPIHGHTCNPWNTRLSPGGSSGGAAAAIAAGLCSGEIGSDIGGSIRIPAHYCGICGHKPSRRLVSMVGHQLPNSLSGPGMACAGPLAATIDDLELLFDVIVGPSSHDSPAWSVHLPPARIAHTDSFRVGLIDTAPSAPVDGAYRAVIARLADKLRGVGTTVVKGPFDECNMNDVHRLFINMLRAAASDGLSDHEFMQLIADVERTPADDQSYLAATNRAIVQRHRDWRRASQQVSELDLRVKDLFDRVDVLVMPAASTAAFPIDRTRPREQRTLSIDGVSRDYNEQLLWAGLAVLLGLPSTVVPIGVQDDGLPVGVQIIGRYLDDKTCLAFARQIESLTTRLRPAGFD